MLSSLLMALVARGVYGLGTRVLGQGKMGLLLGLAAAILLAVVIYVAAAVLSRSVTREDMHLIPGGEKIAKILHMR